MRKWLTIFLAFTVWYAFSSAISLPFPVDHDAGLDADVTSRLTRPRLRTATSIGDADEGGSFGTFAITFGIAFAILARSANS